MVVTGFGTVQTVVNNSVSPVLVLSLVRAHPGSFLLKLNLPRFDHVLDEGVGVTDFVVIPGHDFDEVAGDDFG